MTQSQPPRAVTTLALAMTATLTLADADTVAFTAATVHASAFPLRPPRFEASLTPAVAIAIAASIPSLPGACAPMTSDDRCLEIVMPTATSAAGTVPSHSRVTAGIEARVKPRAARSCTSRRVARATHVPDVAEGRTSARQTSRVQ